MVDPWNKGAGQGLPSPAGGLSSSGGEAGGDVPVRVFERVVAAAPTAIALDCDGVTTTYAELDLRANRLAHALLARGITAEAAVAVCLPTGQEAIVAMLAIWKAGGVYVPLDPSHPQARLQAIVDDTQARCLITHAAVAAAAGLAVTQTLRLADEPPGGPGTAPGVALSAEQAAYVLYTSGTTGRPKGVVATHANLHFFTRSARDRYGFLPSDTFCTIARLSFSISFFEVVSPLLLGARLILLDRAQVLDAERLATTLERVTVLHAGPSLLKHLFRYLERAPRRGTRYPAMRHASSGGDLVAPEVLEAMKATFPSAELFVIYGCTEIACMGTTWAVPRDVEIRKTLVGAPFFGVELMLLDEAGRPVVDGEVGEVCFSGPGLCRGYVGQPELTASRFLLRAGVRFYATGDLGRRDASGNLALLGRRDDQVKLHGIRIELGEIEYVLRRAPGVRDAVVVARQDDDGEKMLVAYLVGNRLDDDRQALRAHLLQRLPDYMVPTEFVALQELPLSENLKVDRQALPPPRSPPSSDGGGLAERVARLFARYLGLLHVELDDDFFELGGYSLLALRVTDELGAQIGRALPIGLVFQCPTARRVAAALRSDVPLEPEPVPLNANRSGPAVFLLAAVHIYRRLGRELEPTHRAYGLSIDVDGDRPIELEQLAAEYVRILERAQPEGPYRLAGFSFGGILAFEVAQQLRKKGREVAHLFLIDALLPAPREDFGEVWRRFLELPLRKRARALASEAVAVVLGPRPMKPRDLNADRVRAMDELRTRRYLDATSAYAERLLPYDGPATVVVAQRRVGQTLRFDAFCGWRRKIQTLARVAVDADHLEMLGEGAVQDVAAGMIRAKSA